MEGDVRLPVGRAPPPLPVTPTTPACSLTRCPATLSEAVEADTRLPLRPALTLPVGLPLAAAPATALVLPITGGPRVPLAPLLSVASADPKPWLSAPAEPCPAVKSEPEPLTAGPAQAADDPPALSPSVSCGPSTAPGLSPLAGARPAATRLEPGLGAEDTPPLGSAESAP